MPIYEYKCKSCGQVQEVLLGSKETVSLECPNCGSSDFTRLFSAAFVSTGASPNNGKTCCGRDERCETPPCAVDDKCRRVR